MTWAISRRLSDKGLKIGLFKPFGTVPIYEDGLWADHDIVLLKDVMGLEEPLELLNPYPSPEKDCSGSHYADIINKIKSISKKLYSKKDILIVIGSNDIFFDGIAQPLPDIALINELNGACILLNRYRKSSASIYSIFSVGSLLKDRLKGCFLLFSEI